MSSNPTWLSSRTRDHRTKIYFDSRPCYDGNTPGFRRRLMLMDTLEIFVHIDPFFNPPPKLLGSALHHNFRSAEHPSLGQRAFRLRCAPNVLGKNWDEHEIRIQGRIDRGKRIGSLRSFVESPAPGQYGVGLRVPIDLLFLDALSCIFCREEIFAALGLYFVRLSALCLAALAFVVPIRRKSVSFLRLKIFQHHGLVLG